VPFAFIFSFFVSSFFLGSQYVLIMFPICSHQVLNMFLKFSKKVV
jgi:hypothetical protein